jgi:integrase
MWEPQHAQGRKVEHFFFEDLMILIDKAKGGKSRYVPILPEPAQELRTYLDDRSTGYLFETNSTCRAATL